MAKRRTEEQIIGVLKESEAGMKTSELCRKHGISETTFYKWKDKFGGLTVSEVRRLRGREVVRISAIPATRFGRLPATVSVVTPPV